MKKYLFSCLFVLYTFLSLAAVQKYYAKDVKKYSIIDFLSNVNYSGASFSKDKSKILVSSDKSGIYNVYYIPVEGGEPVQQTNSIKESVFSLGYFPHDDRFLYTSDQGGNELNHIYVHELDGTTKDITPGEGLKAVFYGWANDNKSFFIGSNERDKKFFDVFEVNPSDYSKTLIYQNETGYDFSGISPDRNNIVLTKTITSTNSDLYLYNRKTKEMKHLTPHEGEISFNAQTFSPDGKKFYYTTDENSEFSYLVSYELSTGKKVTVEKVNWDIWYAYFSKQGKYLVIGINNDSKTELKIYNTANMKAIKLPEMPNADITSVSISDDEKYIAFYASSSRSPRDLFIYKIGEKTSKQLTKSLNPAINPDDLVEAKVVRFKSFDGVEIPGVLYMPHQADKNNKVPAIVWVHGGPGGQSRVGYVAVIQYLVNNGYAVYAINNRGSSGYGKTFYKMDDRKHGEGDLDDCISSKKMLVNTGYVDDGKIGILGGSYGGFMTLAALTFRPKEFAVGVDLFGVSNWVRTLNSIPPYWESFRKSLEVEMGEAKDTVFLKSFSPLFHADKIERPLLVLQGANDPRVLKVESDEIVEAVKKKNVPVEYIVFDDEGHGLIKKENQKKGYEGILKFLDKYLKNTSVQ